MKDYGWSYCEGCGQGVWRERGEHARSERLGRRFYCSLQCLGKNRDNSLYRNCGDASWLTPGYFRDDLTPFRWYMARIRHRSHKPTDLLISDLVEQWEAQGGRCPHTGWLLALPPSTAGWKDGLKPDCASLDRVDSSQGYVKGNVVFLAVMYNYAKNAFRDDEVLRFCKAVVGHNPE